jgi:hypothetical protein
MGNVNGLLSNIEANHAWELFQKDWLFAIRSELRKQLSDEYRIFVESERNDYSLIIRREPDNQVVAAMELLSPSNKGLDREHHLRKRGEYLDAGISLLELDPLLHGERDLPEPLARLTEYQRIAWTAYHLEGRRKYRGWGWNQTEPLPQIDWRIDAAQTPILDLSQTLAAAIEFNRWEEFVAERAKPDQE